MYHKAFIQNTLWYKSVISRTFFILLFIKFSQYPFHTESHLQLSTLYQVDDSCDVSLWKCLFLHFILIIFQRLVVSIYIMDSKSLYWSMINWIVSPTCIEIIHMWIILYLIENKCDFFFFKVQHALTRILVSHTYKSWSSKTVNLHCTSNQQ